MVAPPNPYEARERDRSGRIPIPDAYQQYAAYAVPSLEAGSPYTRAPGWSPELRTSAQETPSAARLGQLPRYDSYPDPVRAPEEWYRPQGADIGIRHSVEDVDADGWQETKVMSGDSNPSMRRFAPNPREIPPPEPRPTTAMSPRTYSFTRPFDQHNRGIVGDLTLGSARRFNGQHFSMADHRRDYPILGMAPVTQRRNTYRLDPPPWDTDIVDMPPEVSVPSARITSVEVPYSTRSHRLG